MMSSMSPGERVARKEESSLQIQPLSCDETLCALEAFQTICQTSYGPQGRLKMVHNNTGGHVTLTSLSQRLLPAISVSKPVLKLVTSAIQEHLKMYSDGALFAGLLSIKLVRSSLALAINRRLIIELNELILELCCKYLYSEQCACKVSIDLSSTEMLIVLITSLISSKPGCLCGSSRVDFLARLLLQSFLKTCDFGSGLANFSKRHILCVEGLPVSSSHVVDGVLFETPQIPIYKNSDLSMRQVSSGQHEGCVKTAIFNVSMSGDSEEFMDAVYEMEEGIILSDEVLKTLKKCTECMVSHGVGLVASQKVVHPMVKKLLRGSGVLVLDRLSIRYISSIHDLAGGQMLSSFHTEPDESCYGYLREVTHRVLEGKSYVHLSGRESAIHTLVLCHQNEEALAEMKCVCEVVQHVLKMTLTTPLVLCGAGCWQIHLASHIKQQVHVYNGEWCKTLGCSSAVVQTVADNFTRCLVFTAGCLRKPVDHLTDQSNHHLWIGAKGCDTSPKKPAAIYQCECGALEQDLSDFKYLDEPDSLDSTAASIDARFTKSPRVLDAFLPYVSAFKLAVGLSNMILGIETFVQDNN